MIYIVITEECYGGNKPVFSSKNTAEVYAANNIKNKDYLVKSLDLDAKIGDTVYIVVTEEWYGGDKVKAFKTKAEANKYIGEISIDNKDIIVISEYVV